MRIPRTFCSLLVLLAASTCLADSRDGNRLTYLDGDDPYYVGLSFPKLTTPQWVGEEGVEAVVILAVDDMKDTKRYETFLRPILNRLKAIDGRAGLSIMTCQVDPNDPQLQVWITEGVNIDVHTVTHPCPLLKSGDFPAARKTYHDCVDLLSRIPNNRPVAFRMPCCDSKNTLSPRFFAEIFNKTSPEHRYLSIDSSVFQLLTPDDPAPLPRSLVYDPDGRERFRKYVPFPSFVNTIENYPYPYVIDRLCWEFPCMVPSDWEAQHIQKPNNPKTVEDLKAALDAVVIKQGVFDLVFHPHGWIKNEQVVELIDHAVAKHGKKVKFLSFREALERLEKNLLGGPSLRLANGRDNGVRVLDLDRDGYLDVVIGNNIKQETRRWDPKARQWRVSSFPLKLVTTGLEAAKYENHGVPFGVIYPDGHASMLGIRRNSLNGATQYGAWHFGADDWEWEHASASGLPDGSALSHHGRGQPRLRDLDGDGQCEIIQSEQMILKVSTRSKKWEKLGFTLPAHARIARNYGDRFVSRVFLEDFWAKDGGVRFVDLDGDGRDDVLYSDGSRFGVYLFDTIDTGWSRRVMSGSYEDADALPGFVRDRGEHNGAWVHSRQIWWQNENTAQLPDLVDRRSFNDLLKDVEPRGKSAEASLRSIRVKPGFTVELVAQEPLVEDPIAFEWGADGKLWVLEMGDYPLGADGKGKAGGLVRVLEDKDGDGRYDKATTFLDGLNIPSAIMPWRNGVLIGAAPDILYAEDRDGDGKADHREVLFTGFKPGNPQHRLNGFELGLDGWVYGANGDSGGQVRSTKTGQTVNIGGRDFRFNPDDGQFELESGQTQYGRHRDDWGHWFGNSNPTWAWQYVLDDADLRRNSQFAPLLPRQVLEPDTNLFPISRTVARFNTPGAVNHVTSANSPTPYRDDLFGPGFASSLFVSEPVHNLVHRMVLAPDGSTFKGRRGPDEADREFLASSDNWTRPTMLKTGPDGALWIADMYRAVIEHPEWIPDDWEAKLDLRAGSTQGRIYRVFPVEKTPRTIPRLDRLDTPGLVAALDSPSGWQRDTAQRLLLHKGDRTATAPLQALVAKSPRPKTRLQSLWTLACLEALSEETGRIALADVHPQVRRQAIKAIERKLNGSPRLTERVLGLADDPDAEVRLQVALSLGFSADPRAGAALARIVLRAPDDLWLRAAVLSSCSSHATALLAALFAEGKVDALPTGLIEPLFGMVGGSKERKGMTALIPVLAAPAGQGGRFAPWQFSALAGLLDSAARARTELGAEDRDRLAAVIKAARDRAGDDKADEDERLAALRLLGRDPHARDADREFLVNLLRPQVPGRVQLAALTALGRHDDPRLPAALLAGWKGDSPQLRGAVLDTLLSRPSWTGALLSSLEDLCTPAAEIDPAHRSRLLGLRDPALKARAVAVLARETSPRQEVLERYRPALAHQGDAEAGKAVFKRACTTCHRLGGEGFEVGPDLAALNDKSAQSLLVAILDPNRALEAKFTDFTIETVDGRILNGLIASEAGNAVTLRRQEGKEDVLLRSDIQAMVASGKSLMPEGLEKDLTIPDFANLIAYLGAVGPPPKTLDGNRPQTVRPAEDGSLVFRASAAEVYGDMLTFETLHQNLGYWSSPNDHAGWRFDGASPGRYSVWLEWACDDSSAGNTLVVEAGSQKVEHRVAGTGSWDSYRSEKVGELILKAGVQRLEVRPLGKIRGALIDLRALELRPMAGKPPDPKSCCEP